MAVNIFLDYYDADDDYDDDDDYDEDGDDDGDDDDDDAFKLSLWQGALVLLRAWLLTFFS